MLRKITAIVLALTLSLLLFSCSDLPFNFDKATKDWTENQFSNFVINSNIDVVDKSGVTNMKSYEMVTSQNNGNIIGSFYRKYSINTENAVVITEYTSNEYFDGVYYFRDQNGILSYEKYLATDFVEDSRISTNLYLTYFTKEQLKKAVDNEDGTFTLTLENTAELNKMITDLTRVDSYVSAENLTAKSVTVTFKLTEDVMTGYDVKFELKTKDNTIKGTTSIEFIANKGQVVVPDNLDDYLGDDKKDMTNKVEELVKDPDAKDYADKRQEIIDKYGDAAVIVIEREEEKNDIKVESKLPTSDTTKSEIPGKDESKPTVSVNSTESTESNESSESETVSSKPIPSGIDWEYIE